MKKGCLFDLDGTLVDSLLDLALSTNEVLKKHDFKTHDISSYNQFVGNGVRKLIGSLTVESANNSKSIDRCFVFLSTFLYFYIVFSRILCYNCLKR